MRLSNRNMACTVIPEDLKGEGRDGCRNIQVKIHALILDSLAGIIETNLVLEKIKRILRDIVPEVLESCILLLDPEAPFYSRPQQCDLYDKPMSCTACKRGRPAVVQAVSQKQSVIINKDQSIQRRDGQVISTGAEAAIPIMDQSNTVIATISLMLGPGAAIKARDLWVLKDTAHTAGHLLEISRRYWQATRDKLRLGQELANLQLFVPQSVRKLAADQDNLDVGFKEEKDLSVLLLDIENYTKITHELGGEKTGQMVEKLFSSFVDLIHRSGGDINETMGDGLMIIFREGDPAQNAANALAAALDIRDTAGAVASTLPQAAAEMKINMGVASGRAVVGFRRFAGARHSRMTYTASGTVTNLAARLSDLAKQGDILICPQTKQLLGNTWTLYSRGKYLLKGINQPVQVYSPLKPQRKAETLSAQSNDM